jgi:membrane protein DedA with SNARE-associated domain/rhodanese-related sulfurtransferase
MSRFISLTSQHGYILIFVIVFLEAIGLPVPAALALMAGGAAVASGSLHAPAALLLAVTGLVLGDSLLYILGSYMGWALLAFLCKVSANPETCILRSAESFYKRGRTTLLLAEFIPGINTMAPPLAGSMKMRFGEFLGLDVLGASFYVLVYGTSGFLFRDFLAAITRSVQAAGHVGEIVIIVATCLFVAHRVWRYWKNRVYRIVPRVQVTELATKLRSEELEQILLVDVRSHGYYDADAARIRGSIRIEPNNLSEEVAKLPRDKNIYLYCTCQREATSARVAYLLREQGFKAFVIAGGLAAWRKAGLAIENVPASDFGSEVSELFMVSVENFAHFIQALHCTVLN